MVTGPTGQPESYALRSLRGPAQYLGSLLGVFLAAWFIAFGPLFAKAFFGYYLAGSVLAMTPFLEFRYVTLTPQELHIKQLHTLKISYHAIKGARRASPGIFRRLSGFRGETDIEVLLHRAVWMPSFFPLPFVYPTRRLTLPGGKKQDFLPQIKERLNQPD